MRKYTYDELRFFINSELSEKDYFSGIDYDKDSLVYLKEFLKEMSEASKKFIDSTKPFLESIQEKNPWVKMVSPIEQNILNITDSRGSFFLAEVGQYNNSIESCSCVPSELTGRFSEFIRAKLRIKILENSSEELFQINRASYDLLRVQDSKTTYSGLFVVSNYLNYSTISCGNRPLVRISTETEDFKTFTNYEFAKDDSSEEKASLSPEESQSLVNKLYLR